MPAKKGLKQLAVWMEEDEKESFRTLCDSLGIDVSTVIRKFVGDCIENQSVEFVAANQSQSDGVAVSSTVDREVIKSIFRRLNALETAMPQFEVEDLKRMREEILESDFGTMRSRLGVVEKELHKVGGSIAWGGD